MSEPIQLADADNFTRKVALERARQLAPLLRERSAQCAVNRSAPTETIQDFKNSGLLRLMQPKRFGGHELGWDVFCEVVQIFAEACGAQAWVYRVLADHAKMLGTFPEQAQQDIWGSDMDVQASSSFAPAGKAVPVDGGYRFSGSFGFSSGIDHASWVILGGIVQHTNGNNSVPQGPQFFLVEKSEGCVIDDWYVNGLEGTGSKSFKVVDAFVPGHRVLSQADSVAGRGPGTKINSAAVYRLPRYSFTGSGFSALMVGMARGLFQDWQNFISKKQIDGKPARTVENIQIAAATCGAKIDAAERLYLPSINEVMRMLEAGETPSEGFALESRRNNSYACKLAMSAANQIFSTFGASAMYTGNSMERQYRNLLMASQHMSINWPSSATGYASKLLTNRCSDN